VLVIFVIRTRASPWRSAPHPGLVAGAVAVVGVAVAVPFTPLDGVLGFTAPPAGLLLFVAGLVVLYLGSAEAAKRVFYGRRLQRS